jgi:purine-nucleoside phosphorylase
MIAPAPVGIVAGSGIALDPVLDSTEWRRPFSDFPDVPGANVAGHPGCFTRGLCQGRPLILQSGRVHLYEGRSYDEITGAVNALHSLGVSTIVFTNAAGGLRPTMRAGDLIAVDRVLTWPYQAWKDRPKELFPTLTLPGAPARGTYVWVPGPNYETRAEIGALQSMGAAAVGMSTAPELLRARELGLRTAVVSCITNNCCAPQILTHDHVIQTARQASESLVALLRDSLPLLA